MITNLSVGDWAGLKPCFSTSILNYSCLPLEWKVSLELCGRKFVRFENSEGAAAQGITNELWLFIYGQADKRLHSSRWHGH